MNDAIAKRVIDMGKAGIVAIMLVTAGLTLSGEEKPAAEPREYTQQEIVEGVETGPVWNQEQALESCKAQPTVITEMQCRQAAFDTNWN